MHFADAITAAGTEPIWRAVGEGLVMIGYRDGSVDVLRRGTTIKRLPAPTGRQLGYTDWQPMIHGRMHDRKQAEDHAL